MMSALIGYSGFVGSNLLEQKDFDFLYNSKNIGDIRNKHFDLVVCAGVSATKWLANQNPEEDLLKIQGLIDHLQSVTAENFVLISTVDVYDFVDGVTENTLPNPALQEAYGKNRYFFEQWVSGHFKNYTILRLPGLFGPHLKKNFIYDMINPLPVSIIPKLWSQIIDLYMPKEQDFIEKFYQIDSSGNRVLQFISDFKMRSQLQALLSKQHISSLIFTDARSCFQFYPLKFLLKDIEWAMHQDIKLLNLAVEPISAEDLFFYLMGTRFVNQIKGKSPLFYNMKSTYDQIFGGAGGYLYSRDLILQEIKGFFVGQRGAVQ
ncbi:MAG: NAD(P)-dependent oxidoreductase [Gammaproteobacteria bacterium]|nr:NAD(P)-dependent oxidoreductase [Gammaproteobacteria bacterium]